ALDVTLRSSIDGPITLAGPDEAGAAQASRDDLTTGTHNLIATVTDSRGQTAEATRTIVVTDPTAPAITINAPDNGAELIVGDNLEFRALVQDESDPPAALQLTLTSSLDGMLTFSGPTGAGLLSADLSGLSVGQHDIVLTATDSSDATAAASVTVNVIEDLPPTIALLSPPEETTVVVGDSVTIDVQVGDDRTPIAELNVTLESDLDGPIPLGTPDLQGILTAMVALTEGNHTLTASVTDARDQTATATRTITLVANQAPTIDIDSPQDNLEVAFGEQVTFDLTVADDEDPPTALTVELISSLDGAVGFTGPDAQGNVLALVNTLSVGTHLFTIAAIDSRGARTEEQRTIVVSRAGQPVEVTILFDNPTSGQPSTLSTLTADYASAFDGQPRPEGMVTWQWFMNGEGTDIDGNTVAGVNTRRGETWRAEVTIVTETVVYTGSDSVSILNTPPTLAGAVVTPSGPTEASLLTCAGQDDGDVDEDPLTTQYAWRVDGVLVEDATSSTLSSDNFSKEQAVTCTVTVTDTSDATASATSDPVTI
ncbi:MAG: hypothetical protein AAFX99_35610, partial [Myxococcota bacterium]